VEIEIMNEQEKDEFDLSAVFVFLRKNFKLMVFGLVLGVLLGLGLSGVMHRKFKASAVIQIGQLPVQSGTGFNFEPIEPAAQVLERFRLRNTVSQVLTGAGLPTSDPAPPAASLAKSTLKLSPVRSTNYIQLSASGYSPAEAEKTLASAADLLVTAHNKEFNEAVKGFRDQLESYKRQIVEGTADLSKLDASRASAGSASAGGRFESNIVAINLADTKRSELRRLQADRLMLESVLSSPRCYPTKVIDAPQSESEPYSPPTLPLMAILGLAGLFAGILLAWLRRDRSNVKHRTA
jgi:capsular polysaccharide biosynthesis protein